MATYNDVMAKIMEDAKKASDAKLAELIATGQVVDMGAGEDGKPSYYYANGDQARVEPDNFASDAGVNAMIEYVKANPNDPASQQIQADLTRAQADAHKGDFGSFLHGLAVKAALGGALTGFGAPGAGLADSIAAQGGLTPAVTPQAFNTPLTALNGSPGAGLTGLELPNVANTGGAFTEMVNSLNPATFTESIGGPLTVSGGADALAAGAGATAAGGVPVAADMTGFSNPIADLLTDGASTVPGSLTGDIALPNVVPESDMLSQLFPKEFTDSIGSILTPAGGAAATAGATVPGWQDLLKRLFAPGAAGTGALSGLAGGAGAGGSAGSGILGALLGMYASDKAGERYDKLARDLADRSDPFGSTNVQGARKGALDRYNTLAGGGFGAFLDGEYRPAAERAADIAQRKLGVNPANQPGALAEITKYVTDQGYDAYMKNRGQLAGEAGAGFNPASGASIASTLGQKSIDEDKNFWNSIGYGANAVTKPDANGQSVIGNILNLF